MKAFQPKEPQVVRKHAHNLSVCKMWAERTGLCTVNHTVLENQESILTLEGESVLGYVKSHLMQWEV